MIDREASGLAVTTMFPDFGYTHPSCRIITLTTLIPGKANLGSKVPEESTIPEPNHLIAGVPGRPVTVACNGMTLSSEQSKPGFKILILAGGHTFVTQVNVTVSIFPQGAEPKAQMLKVTESPSTRLEKTCEELFVAIGPVSGPSLIT